MNKGSSALGLLAGFGAGAAAMYFLDPDRGSRRRAIVADKVKSSVGQLPRAARVTKQDISNRAYGFWAEVQHLFSGEQAPDDVVEARVRSKMGRIVSHPHAIKVSCSAGNVTLTGPIFTSEVPRLVKCIGSVAGVRSVENKLDAHETAEGVAARWSEMYFLRLVRKAIYSRASLVSRRRSFVSKIALRTTRHTTRGRK